MNMKIFPLIGLDFSFIMDECICCALHMACYLICQTTAIFFSVPVWLQVFWQANPFSKVLSNV